MTQVTSAANSSPLRVGIIGAGWPGERHAEGYVDSGLAEVIAISDLDQKRAAATAKLFGASQVYGDFKELLANPDIEAVSVALPNFLHHPATIAALEAGKHVLCEKPPAVSLAQAQEMQAASEKNGRLLAYAVQRRFNPVTEKLRVGVAEGLLGDVYHARAVWTRTWGVPRGLGNWFTDPARAGGGALIDIGIHVLDMAWFLMGCPQPVTVSGQVFNKFPDETKTDDSAFALLRFADGRSIQVEASWVLAQDDDQMNVNLYGTKGGAQLNDHTLNLYKVSEEGRTRTSITLYGGQTAFTAQVTNFIHAIRGEEPPRTSAAQGTMIMTMLDAIYRSAREGREVELG